jgi:uncharacterized membrane protein YhiD involved in acid resistance
MREWLILGDATPFPTDLNTLVLGLLLAFLCGQVIGWVYMHTHTGLSYSRTFVSSLIILPMTVAMAMTVLDNNLVSAFSLMAVFAIVRFRNIVRDTLDTVYILSLIVVGMACGTQKFATAVVGTLLATLVLIYLWYTSFGSRQRYDMILNLHRTGTAAELGPLQGLLDRHARRVHCASQRTSQGGEGVDLSYRLLLRDPARSDLLLEELRADAAVTRVTTMKMDEESEV